MNQTKDPSVDSGAAQAIPFSYVVFSVAGVFVMLAVTLLYATHVRGKHMAPDRLDREARSAVKRGEALTPEQSGITVVTQDATQKH